MFSGNKEKLCDTPENALSFDVLTWVGTVVEEAVDVSRMCHPEIAAMMTARVMIAVIASFLIFIVFSFLLLCDILRLAR